MAPNTRQAQLGLVAVVMVLGMATWFSASAVAPAIRADWGLGSRDATWLTGAVQLGFVAGALTSAVLTLSDRVPLRILIAASGVLAAVATAAIPLVAHSLTTALPLRFLTGFALAGLYPPGLKLMATWFDRGLGLALGVVVGALTLGGAVPHLIAGEVDSGWQPVMYAAAALTLAGAAVAFVGVRPGPLVQTSAPFDPRKVLVLFERRETRLATAGYLGHMWELYAMWTWLPTFLAASFARRESLPDWTPDPRTVAFVAIGGAGMLGCVLAGYWGDRIGRAPLAAGAMAVSGTCCLLAAALYGAHPLLLLPVVTVWGCAVIADSGLFSACTSSTVDQRYVGTALTTQLALGFLLTVVTIQAVPSVVDTGGWRLAVGLLALGPLVGVPSMLRLHHLTKRQGLGSRTTPTKNSSI